MTSNKIQDAQDALDTLEEAKEAYEKFQEAWRQVGSAVRRIDDLQWNRVDAYPGWNGTRDVGAGVDMAGWMAEVEETLQDEIDGAHDQDAEHQDDGRCHEKCWEAAVAEFEAAR